MGIAHCHEGIQTSFSTSSKLTLKYFPIAGRAEPIRLALHLGNVKFHDHRITGQDWEKHKDKMPYGQLPVLMVDAKPIAQTKAILRYVGKLIKHEGHFLYPKEPIVAVKVDELLDAFDDLWILLAPTYRISDQGQKEMARQRLFQKGSGEASAMIDNLEGNLARSSNGYAVPEAKSLTIVDLVYFAFLGTIRSGFIEGLDPHLFQAWPKIMEHKEKIAKIPIIKKYYEDASLSNPTDSPFYKVYKPGY